MSDADPSLPTFMVIGAMKSATTSLCYELGRHPDVFVSRPKEPQFFSRKAYDGDLAPYRALFAGSRAAARGEGSTNYTKNLMFPACASRIAAVLPAVRMIYIVRHPIDRMESHYRHMLTERPELRDRTLDAYVAEHPSLLDTSLYWRQISAYRDHFPDEQIRVFLYDDFVRDGARVVREACAFLGVDPALAPIADQAARRNSSEKLLQTPLRRRIADVPGAVRAARTVLPSFVRRQVQPLLREPAPELDTRWKRSTLRKVADQIRPDMERFLAFYGRPTDTWSLP